MRNRTMKTRTEQIEKAAFVWVDAKEDGYRTSDYDFRRVEGKYNLRWKVKPFIADLKKAVALEECKRQRMRELEEEFEK